MSTVDLGEPTPMTLADAYHGLYLLALASELAGRVGYQDSAYWLRRWGRAMAEESSS